MSDAPSDGGEGDRPTLSAPEALKPRECTTCGGVNLAEARFCQTCGHRFLDARDGMEHERDQAVADPLIGRVIAERYRIDELIGRGGMGVVYRVEHVRIGKMMAMKLLHGELARQVDVVKRFRREAEAVSKLDHPNTVQVFDFGRSEGLMYLVMELLSGEDLGHVLQAEGSLPFARVARIGAQVAGSVAQAHQRGIVHRDLKPENVRVLAAREEADVVKVMDFGLAKLRESEDLKGGSITRAGFIVGTPYYMAPEHIRGDHVDARSDVYALGALMYKCLAGVPPFWAPTPVGVLTKHLTEPVVPPSVRASRRDVPPEADAIVMRAMAKDPADRYPSMEALREELVGYLRKEGESTGVISTNRMALPSVAPPEVYSDSGRKVAVATRGDIDRYEGSLRRQSMGLRALALLALLGLAAGVGYAWREGMFATEPAIVRDESEPNDEPADADLLVAGQPLTAFIGQRIDMSRSDADVYRLDAHATQLEPRFVRVDVSGVPNMDLVIDVFRGTSADPVLVIDGAGFGQPEQIPNLPLVDDVYFLRVRELWRSGQYPTENVSDSYTIEWNDADVEEGDERETNDSFELAETISVGQTRRGFVSWDGDVDMFCLDENASDVEVTLSAVQSLDLELRVLDRARGTPPVVFNAGARGEGETSGVLPQVHARTTCVVVAAHADQSSSVRADASERWQLRVQRRVAPLDPEAP